MGTGGISAGDFGDCYGQSWGRDGYGEREPDCSRPGAVDSRGCPGSGHEPSFPSASADRLSMGWSQVLGVSISTS